MRYFIGRLAAALAMTVLTLLGAAAGAPAKSDTIDYEGFTIDISVIADHPDRSKILTSLRRQINIVATVAAPPAAKTFFKSVRIKLKHAPLGKISSPGSYTRGGKDKLVVLFVTVYPGNQPILLHELLHACHDKRLPQGYGNAAVLAFYQRAKDARLYGEKEYVLKNVAEFFAVTASLYLFGTVAREPFTRDNLIGKQPVYARWLENEFGKPH